MDLENIITADSSPYPEIRVQGENKLMAERLTYTFGGSSGEFDSTAQYVYQSIMLKNSHPPQSELLLRIAKTEMHHLYMIGELITKLGGQPIYGWKNAGKTHYWNGEQLNYSPDPATMYLHDLAGEQKAYSTYVSLARQSGDRYVFALLTRIALDEMIHASLFKTLLSDLRK